MNTIVRTRSTIWIEEMQVWHKAVWWEDEWGDGT